MPSCDNDILRWLFVLSQGSPRKMSTFFKTILDLSKPESGVILFYDFIKMSTISFIKMSTFLFYQNVDFLIQMKKTLNLRLSELNIFSRCDFRFWKIRVKILGVDGSAEFARLLAANCPKDKGRGPKGKGGRQNWSKWTVGLNNGIPLAGLLNILRNHGLYPDSKSHLHLEWSSKAIKCVSLVVNSGNTKVHI